MAPVGTVALRLPLQVSASPLQCHMCGCVTPGPGSCLLHAGCGSSPRDWGDAHQQTLSCLLTSLPALHRWPHGPSTPERAAVFPPMFASCPLVCTSLQPNLTETVTDIFPHPLGHKSSLSLQSATQLPLQSQTVTGVIIGVSPVNKGLLCAEYVLEAHQTQTWPCSASQTGC